MRKLRLPLVGDIQFPEDFDKIFTSDGKYLITKCLGDDYCFEMSGESMYYALQELEKKDGDSFYTYKSKIINAIVARITWGRGTLLHKSFTGGFDTQFRSTNSALRTLLAASKEGFVVDEEIKKIANNQFKYFFRWKKGIWFCHDSSELDGKTPLSHIRTKRVNKDSRNTLTLNTHLDSVSTLLLLKKQHKEYLLDFNLDDFLEKGLQAINQLCELKSNIVFIENFLQKIDAFFLNVYVKKVVNKNGFVDTVYERIIHPLLFKVLFPTIFFNNGFIARDLSVMNRHLDYLLVNVVDFSRVMNLYKVLVKERLLKEGLLNIDCLSDKLDRAIALVEKDKCFLTFIRADELQSAWYAEMYFSVSNLDSRYVEKARQIHSKGIYCLNSPFYKLNID